MNKPSKQLPVTDELSERWLQTLLKDAVRNVKESPTEVNRVWLKMIKSMAKEVK